MQQNTNDKTSLLSGDTHLAIALNGNVPSDNTFTLMIESVNPTNNTFSEYVYLRGANTKQITGADDSSKQQALRFAADDEVVVYNNGVVLDSSVYDTSVANRILFNPVLPDEHNSIRVVVFKDVTAERKTLTFEKTYTSCSIKTAWSNVPSVGKFVNEYDPEEYTVFICRDISNIRLNSQFTISRDQETDNLSGASPSDWMILLSNSPHKSYDRELNYVVDITTLIDEQTSILYELDAVGNPALSITNSAMQDVFPPLTITDTCMVDGGKDDISHTNVKRKAKYIN